VRRGPYRVDWAEIARQDLFSIIDYLHERNADAAAAALAKLERRASSLRRTPARGRIVPEFSRIQLRDYRELIVRPYRLLYRIAGRRVLVLGVFDSRRNLEDALLDRLLGER
jgi:addiction module RelE/StbE family toxin